MAIDWSGEPFVRLFKRDTEDDLLLSWEARAVWYEFLKKCDRSGLLATKLGVRGLAIQLRVPEDVIERVLQELLEDGRIQSVPSVGFLAPNYIDANYTPRSDAARQETSRLRNRLSELRAGVLQGNQDRDDTPSRGITRSHEASRGVTQIIHSDHSDHSSSEPRDSRESESRSRPKRERRGIPEDWKPRDEEREYATSLGLNCDDEAKEFHSYWLGDGRPKKNWDLTFRHRLTFQAKHKQPWKRAQTEIRHIPDL